MSRDRIRIRGATQNNLKNLDIDLPLYELVVVTGVSGSGKSSLAFDTVYAEGQRRYVETFSPYARQFLDRMDKPRVVAVQGIPPAIAIDQTNPVRTSRSTVGTMTELTDHLKLLYARAARLFCRGCGREVRRDSAESVCDALIVEGEADPLSALVSFEVAVPGNFSRQEVEALLARQGYTRVEALDERRLRVLQGRVRLQPDRRERIVEALEAAFEHGRGHIAVQLLDAAGAERGLRRFSTALHCADCDIDYRDPIPNTFSFNSPAGACESCRGFGRSMGIDYGLVVPDGAKTLAGGAVKPWQTQSYLECQKDLIRFARKRRVPVDVPWRDLDDATREWVLEGEGDWDDGEWYGVRRFFDWLETKSYRMHIRVLLSRYRSYETCRVCQGARLKPDALLWRLGTREDADAVLAAGSRFRATGVNLDETLLQALPGVTLHDLVLLPIERTREFFQRVQLPVPLDEATGLLLDEIRTRLRYLSDVGLGYLTLDRQSRTLSGGEVQRINLTTALGTSLVNSLFVLDEPSIGLHPRDMGRIVEVLHRLRDAGNSLLVVEHDPQVMLAADRILDMGPGPGARGGEVMYFGPPQGLYTAEGSLTAEYLSGRRLVAPDAPAREPDADTEWLTVTGAAEHNLQDIDVALPLGRLVCVTGVSGSGKSTLVEEVLHRALRKHLGLPSEAPGPHHALLGADQVDGVVMVDQSPIGKTARSNPASYVGAFDAIRKLFAATPMSRERGYGPGTFSFNAGNGRCPACGGSGFEHVEMQFLSDVYLRCPDCNGRRFRAEVLEVRWAPPGGRPRSVADVLAMTVTDALQFFAAQRDVVAALEPLAAVGLDYLTLGQPVPTLSGGEAQRLKLASHLVEKVGASRTRTLFLFDEPTTGLHFDDIATLLAAFRRLLEAGHSLVVIEHNLDVIRAADWVVDLGPEGGDGGGRVVFAGTPAALAQSTDSHTGVALAAYRSALGQPLSAAPCRPLVAEAAAEYVLAARHAISIHNAREHNLKNVDIRIPRRGLTVITGVSGSGKSTVAFDILFAEGQRRYLESLNAYARQFVQPASRPDVDAIYGIPPTVAIEQRTSRGGRKSTVATLTELHHFLRLLFVKLGVQRCPDCEIDIEPQSEEAIVANILDVWDGQRARLLAPLVVARKGYYTDLAKWAAARGFERLRVDGEMTPTDSWPRLDRFREHDIELPIGELKVEPRSATALRELVHRAIEFGKGVVLVAPTGRVASKKTKRRRELLFSTRRACPGCGRSFPEPDPRLFSYNSRHGWCESCFGTGLELEGFDAGQTGEESVWLEGADAESKPCRACAGQRLRPDALAVRFRDRSIAGFAALSVNDAEQEFRKLRLRGREAEIARDVLAELRSRLVFLNEVGLGYLTLDRAAPTLSGGEAQRIRLAAQLGSNLQGVCYILDEPTIGLHPRDNSMLLDTLRKLERKGNTVVVVEHDEDTIRRADYVIDLGPGAGVNGGYVVASGSVADISASAESLTGRFLAAPLRHPLSDLRPAAPRDDGEIRITGANANNLKNIDVVLPLGRLVCVTGVSGSGKSTLVREVLHGSLLRALAGKPGAHGSASIDGHQPVKRLLVVDQTPIGKTPRSCPATYVGFWDYIRRLYAETEEARLRGYQPGRFSFNTAGGRCSACDGQGLKRIEMSFLPDVTVTCEVCSGARFDAETLAVRYKGASIADVLAMSVDEAAEFFAAHSVIHHALTLLQAVGLGYLTLGQQSPTLSGGEAQRIKLVTELARTRPPEAEDSRPSGKRSRARTVTPPHALYILDEPTIGLHMADVEKLTRVLHRLVGNGNSVVVIEHNLDVVAEADWVIDLGPEGGDGGGRVVAAGTPAAVAASRRSRTAPFLRAVLAGRGAD